MQRQTWLEGWRLFGLLTSILIALCAAIAGLHNASIILADAAVGERPVVGIFHTSHIENAVNQIRQLLAVSMTRLPGGGVLIG